MLITAISTDCDMVPDLEVFTILKGERVLEEKYTKEIQFVVQIISHNMMLYHICLCLCVWVYACIISVKVKNGKKLWVTGNGQRKWLCQPC